MHGKFQDKPGPASGPRSFPLKENKSGHINRISASCSYFFTRTTRPIRGHHIFLLMLLKKGNPTCMISILLMIMFKTRGWYICSIDTETESSENLDRSEKFRLSCWCAVNFHPCFPLRAIRVITSSQREKKSKTRRRDHYGIQRKLECSL